MIGALLGATKATAMSPWFLAFLFVCSSWLAYAATVEPSLRKLSRIQTTEYELKREFEVKQRKGAELATRKRSRVEMIERFREFLRRMPSEFDTVGLHREMYEHARAVGLALDEVRFSPLQREDYQELYVQQSGSLRAHGTFRALAAYFTRLPTLSYPYLPVSLTLERRTNEGDVHLALEFRTFRYLNYEELEERDERERKSKRRKRN